MPPFNSLLDSASAVGSLPSAFVAALSVPGPATEATAGSFATCSWKCSSASNVAAVVIGPFGFTTIML